MEKKEKEKAISTPQNAPPIILCSYLKFLFITNAKNYKSLNLSPNMEKGGFVFAYDDFSDRLLISHKKKEDRIYGSARVLNLTITFTTTNKVVGIELKHASEYLKSLKINPEILNNLTNAEIIFQQQRDGYLIYFILYSGNHIERVPYNIISQEPILN